MADLTYRFSCAGMRTVLRLFADWRVEGVEWVPPVGPLIVVANHLSNLDPPLLGASLPRRLYFLAKAGLFKPGFAAFLRAYGAFPLNRSGKDVAAYAWAMRLLNRDGAVALFPEAHRNPHRGMQRGVPGVAMLALRSQATILPVGITGTERVQSYLRVLVPTGRIRVRIGRPFTLPAVEGNLSRELLQHLTDQIMFRIAELLPEPYQGVYRLPRREPVPEG